MKTSEETDKIALAYVAAFTAMTNPATDKRADTGQFSYPYLTLPALLDAIRAEYPAHGLAIAQEVVSADRGIGVTTRIIHTSGQWYETGPLVLPAGNTPQTHGSAITYARRYALAAAVGLAPEEDDDGAKASKTAGAGEPKELTSPPASAPSSEAGTPQERARASAASQGSDEAPPASTSSSGTAGASPEEPATPTGGDGEGPFGGVATPEQRTRLLAIYKKPSMVKEKAVELFGYAKPTDVTLLELSSAEVEALILEAAS